MTGVFDRVVFAATMAALITGAGVLAAPAETANGPIGILLAAGDISTCGDKKWNKYADKTSEIIRNVIKSATDMVPSVPVRVLALGDLAYDKGTEQQFECFGKRWPNFDAQLLPIPGNHEYLSENAKHYFDHFKSNSLVNQNGEGKGYYTSNFPRADGPWYLIGLNDNFEQNSKYKKEMEDQIGWLEERLTNDGNKQNCVLAFWHAPTFSSGRHGHNYKTKLNEPLTKNRPMQKAFEMLHRHGASVVLTGHDHNYEQFGPQTAKGNATAERDGIRLFVVGTGGSILTEDRYTKLAANSEGVYGITKGIQGVLKIVLYDNRYTWDFLPIDETKKLPLKTTAADCATRKEVPKT